jgi:hypothetical protein
VRGLISMLPEPSDDWSDEETDNPLGADDRNFYKLEKWTRTARRLSAGNNLLLPKAPF